MKQELHIRDFKVGNYYYRNFGNGNMIYELKPYDLESLVQKFDEYRPIPLSPKLAGYLGFKYFKSYGRKNTRTWYLNHFFIYFGKEKGPKMNNNFLLPYVHNLQNLYWERHRKQLTINH